MNHISGAKCLNVPSVGQGTFSMPTTSKGLNNSHSATQFIVQSYNLVNAVTVE
jgi:hypothetical protein